VGRAPLDQIWVVRAPVPSASTVAWSLGWLDKQFEPDGIKVGWTRDEVLRRPGELSDEQKRVTFREGGNINALIDRAAGRSSRVIGLTWIDERQAIMVRPDQVIRDPADLKGLRVAIPDWLPERQNPTFSAMSLHGIANALAVAGLTLEDVEIIRIPAPVIDFTAPWKFQRVWAGLDWVADGRADAVYVKGAAGAEAAKLRGLAVGVDLDVYPSRIARVNNGTPRPIIVDESMIEQHFDIVVRFLESTLQAADWAANNPVELGRILERETFSGPDGVRAAYRNDFHRSLHPSLVSERIDLLRLQEEFIFNHGFIKNRVDIDAWIDPRPLQEARTRRNVPRLVSS
jgi:2'-hydroxybiphenyl-2-sulfinate desulfinase